MGRHFEKQLSAMGTEQKLFGKRPVFSFYSTLQM